MLLQEVVPARGVIAGILGQTGVIAGILSLSIRIWKKQGASEWQRLATRSPEPLLVTSSGEQYAG